MEQRHAFTMSPTNNPWVTRTTGLAFIWYLSMSPAAALVNLSQTTVVGVPLLRAHYKKAGITDITKHLTKASADFMRGRGDVKKRIAGIPVLSESWSAENAPSLTANERKAMEEGYQRGIIDKTQAHDLASVADSGVEYNPHREKVMRTIGFMFHHAERFNREVTYLAAYRLAREQGMDHGAAVTDAGDITWKVHFDYSNTSRPRAMTGDNAKVLTIFRNFQVNMLFRMFRDMHQSFKGQDKETRQEARNQLVGVTLSLFAHAGIRGVWGYTLLTTLIGMFFPGFDDDDDVDEWLQDALLLKGDGAGVAGWNWIMGLVLNGAPGHALGLNLTDRIGMPDLWFRSSDKDLDERAAWAYYLEQLAGPAVGIAGSMAMNAPGVIGQAGNLLFDTGEFNASHMARGIEKMTPTAIRNVIKTGRYTSEGVTTWYGDPLIEDLNPWQLLVQLNGFTPAEVSERYKINIRLKNHENRITDRRRSIAREIANSVRAGNDIPDTAMKRLKRFNSEFPVWAITGDSIRQSVRSRERASQRNEAGAALNPKLNDTLRQQRAPALYN